MPLPKNTCARWQPEKILSISARLFWKKGYLATSIDDIAKEAKINRATIYYYFDSKAAILYQLASTSMQGLIDQALPLMNSELENEEKLKTFIHNHITFTIKHLGVSGIGQLERRNLPPKLLRSYVNLRDKYEGILRNIIKEGIEQGKLQCKDIKLNSFFILGFMNSIVQWYKKTGELPGEAIASSACGFVSRALGVGDNDISKAECIDCFSNELK
jgi:TetR/AcrR family transcriptional regulator, cholesterol catabolism regulator